jgi:hypothetical protein
MRTKLAALLCASLFVALATTTAIANHPTPPMPEGGISFFYQSACTDVKTKREGMCYVGTDMTGTMYITFFINDELVFIRKVLPDGGYETLWERHEGTPT